MSASSSLTTFSRTYGNCLQKGMTCFSGHNLKNPREGLGLTQFIVHACTESAQHQWMPKDKVAANLTVDKYAASRSSSGAFVTDERQCLLEARTLTTGQS